MQVNDNKSLKIVVAGEGGIGKTALIETFRAGTFVKDTVMTIAVQFHVKKIKIMNEEISLQIWDLGGQKQFYNMGVFERYSRGAHVAMICFDLSDLDTLEAVPRWAKIIPPNVPKILVGTKRDKSNASSILDLIELYIEELNFANYVETSSLEDPTSVKVAFDELLSLISYANFEEGKLAVGRKILTVS
ncbi:MAG: Rab family GTPase [Candidatus Hodarchaeota archaeon]